MWKVFGLPVERKQTDLGEKWVHVVQGGSVNDLDSAVRVGTEIYKLPLGIDCANAN
jgi:hypothetical protein